MVLVSDGGDDLEILKYAGSPNKLQKHQKLGQAVQKMGPGSGTEGGQALIRTVPAGTCSHFHDAWVGGTPMTNCYTVPLF